MNYEQFILVFERLFQALDAQDGHLEYQESRCESCQSCAMMVFALHGLILTLRFSIPQHLLSSPQPRVSIPALPSISADDCLQMVDQLQRHRGVFSDFFSA